MQCPFSASQCTMREIFQVSNENTPQNQYFPANAERMDVHCLESGCIGKYIPLGPWDFPRAGILHPSALEIALGQSLGPRGAKSTPLGNLSGLGGCISQYIPPLGSVRIQYLPRLGGVRTFSSSSILSLGMDQEIHPRRVDWIDSVKINPSLVMMREWYILKRR